MELKETPLAINIKRLKEERGFSYVWLAEQAGVNRNVIAVVVCGVRPNPSINLVVKIAKALDVSIDTLVADEPNTGNGQGVE